MPRTPGRGASGSGAPNLDRPSYCLPLHNLSRSAIEELCEREQSQFDLFELWLDTLTDFGIQDVVALARKFPHRVIAISNRRPPASTTDESPSPSAIDPALLEELSREPLWVDLDHATQAGTLPASPSLPGGARWIVSHHDIEKTPDADELRSLADGLRSTDADIIKIATLCREPRDAIRLLELGLELGEASCPHVVLGMGAHGAGTRVLGPLWSSSWVYAPRVPDGVTAEGQLSRQLLGTLHDALRIDRRTHHP